MEPSLPEQPAWSFPFPPTEACVIKSLREEQILLPCKLKHHATRGEARRGEARRGEAKEAFVVPFFARGLLVSPLRDHPSLTRAKLQLEKLGLLGEEMEMAMDEMAMDEMEMAMDERRREGEETDRMIGLLLLRR